MVYALSKGAERKQDLLAELDRITAILREMDVEVVILFGSLARGDVTSTSDIDLIVVAHTDKRFLDRLHDIYSAVRPQKAVDILVYTPQEFGILREENSFVRKVLDEGRVIYARDSRI